MSKFVLLLKDWASVVIKSESRSPNTTGSFLIVTKYKVMGGGDNS